MVENTPRVLAGRYEVGELIGRGGMAEVHIGHDTRLGRTVAIKILRSDLARDPSFEEIETLSSPEGERYFVLFRFRDEE